MTGANLVATFAPVALGLFAILVAKLVRWNDDVRHVREVSILGRQIAVTNGGLALTVTAVAALVGLITFF